MSKKHNPILVGVGQYTQRKNADHFLDPLSLMVKTSNIALNDSGKTRLKDFIDSVYVVNVQSLTYEDAPGMLSERLGIKPKDTFYSAVGGNTPQMLVNRAAKAITSGKSRAVLIAGGEAVYSLRRSMHGEIVLDWPERQSPKKIDGEERESTNVIEAAYDLMRPTDMYSFFETALRGASGRTVYSHRNYLGQICHHLSCVSSKNPYSWIQVAESANSFTAVTRENRYITYPYTKKMTANMYVDQSAALVMTSEDIAKQLGISPALWVYPMGGADLNDIWFVSCRPHLHESPAIHEASVLALDQAGISLDDIGVFDFYSCFPCAVEMARKEIGIPEDDPRDLTVTGGLPYFGGPINNYSMHAVATVVEKIRSNPSLKAMVTSVGWYMTKHSIIVYGSKPGLYPWVERENDAIQQSINKKALPEPLQKANGRLTIEAYIINHDKSGNPTRGVVMGRLENGLRALAEINEQGKSLLKFEEIELVGKAGNVHFNHESGFNKITF